MRWLHISDLDFGGAGKSALSEKETWDSLLNHVDERTRTGLGPDYIFISGNITRNASIKNFELAKKRIPLLLKKAGLMPDERGWNRIFLVPGNHDIEPALNVTSPKLIKEPTMIRLLNAGHDDQNQNFAFIKKNATKILNPEASIYYPELNNFNQFLQDSMLRGNLINEISPTGMTFFARLEDPKIPVGVICINTAWAPYMNNEDDGANSIPCGSKQVEAAIEILAKQGGLKLLIILGHHPANNLYDFTDVREKAQSKGLPLLYLSSHLHDQDWVYYHNGVGPFVEIGTGAIPHEKHSAYTNYHRINWGYFDGDQIEFEPLCYNHFHPHIWTLDTEAFPNRNFQEYRLKGTINKGHFYFMVPPCSLNSFDQKLDCIGIGLAALSTVAAITRGFASDNDYKADVDGNETPKFWEPELGTFVTLACQILSKWERNVALITSMGSDYNGLVLRRLLQERNIGLLYCRPGSLTGRQIVMTPQNCTDIRYIIDLHIQRGELSAFEKAKLEDLMPKILQSKWIAFDKYELAVIECIFESSQWNMAKRRPLVLFESGSRPLGDTQATSERGLVELKFLDNIDLFTTTWEWISTWAKKDGKSRGKHPDEWVKEIGEERKFHKLLENMLLKLMPPSEIKPQAVVVTLSSQGCYVAFRKTGEFGQYEIKHLVVPNLATNVQSRVGAGDIFRAALIQALLESKVEDLVSNKEQLLQIVNLAQYVAYRWIDRTLSKDYWGNFPINFEDLKNGFSDSVTS